MPDDPQPAPAGPAPDPPSRLLRWGRLAVVLLPLCLYASTLSGGFLVDDEIIVRSNIRLPAGAGPWEIFRRPEQFADFTLPYYRPLTNLSYWVDARLWDGAPAGFHLTSWLLHAANGLLLFALARRLTGNLRLAAVAALLFAAHPIHTESVDLVQGRTDLLATLGLLASLTILLRALGAGTGGRAAAWGAGALGAFLAALLAKEVAVTWPLLAAGLLWADPARSAARLRRGALLLAAGGGLLVGYFLLRQAVLGAAVAGSLGHLLTPQAGLVPLALATYLRWLVWPFSLAFIHTIPAPQAWTEPRLLAAALLAGLVLATLLLLARRDRTAALGLGWTLAALLPVLNLVAIPGFVVAERYLYLPSAGFCLALAALAAPCLGPGAPHRIRVALSAALAVLLVLFAGVIQLRALEWRDPLGIFEALAASNPRSFFVQAKLGLEYLERGRPVEAAAALARAVQLEPANPVAWNNLGVALARGGRVAEAREAYQRALLLDPAYARARENLAALLRTRPGPVAP